MYMDTHTLLSVSVSIQTSCMCINRWVSSAFDQCKGYIVYYITMCSVYYHLVVKHIQKIENKYLLIITKYSVTQWVYGSQEV